MAEQKRLHLWLEAPSDQDASDVDARALQLRQELLAAREADAVTRGRGTLPPDAKGSAVEWAELIVAFTGGLPGMAGLLRAWLPRQRGYRVRLEMNGARLELDAASAADARELVDTWMAAHGGG